MGRDNHKVGMASGIVNNPLQIPGRLTGKRHAEYARPAFRGGQARLVGRKRDDRHHHASGFQINGTACVSQRRAAARRRNTDLRKNCPLLLQRVRSKVHRVIVGGGDNGHPGRHQGIHCFRRAAVVEWASLAFVGEMAAAADDAFKIHQGDVGVRQKTLDCTRRPVGAVGGDLDGEYARQQKFTARQKMINGLRRRCSDQHPAA